MRARVSRAVSANLTIGDSKPRCPGKSPATRSPKSAVYDLPGGGDE